MAVMAYWATPAGYPRFPNRIRSLVSPQHIIERETRQRPWVIAGCMLPAFFYIAALVIESGAGIELSGLQTEELRSIDEHSGALLIATIARSIGFAFLAVPLFFLFRAAQARTDRMHNALIWLTVIGPVILAVQGLITWSAQTDVASQFVDQSTGVGDIYSLADNLREESGGLQTAAGLLLPGMLALIFSFIYVPLWAVRTGLLTRFFGTLGMALGASLLFILQVALLGLLLWLVYFGLLLMGRVPSGRPPAWDAGKAIPWPSPGGDQVAVAGANGGDVVEGDATEIPGVAENPNLARRERAKRRKRKRRH
jgi:hypothetical protein